MKRYVLSALLVTSLSLWTPTDRPPGRGCGHRLRQPGSADHSQRHGQRRHAWWRAGPLPRRVRQPRMTAAGLLPRRSDRPADQRFRDQVRSLDSARRGMERQVPGRRQRRLPGIDLVCGDGHRAAPRIRHRQHRHRPYRRRCEVRAGPSGEGDRLRMARDPRHDRHREADRAQRAGPLRREVVFRRLLGGRSPGDVGGAALPR